MATALRLTAALPCASDADDPAGGRGLRIGENGESAPVLEWGEKTKGAGRGRRRPPAAGGSGPGGTPPVKPPASDGAAEEPPEFGKPIDLEVDPNLVLARPPAAMTFEQAMQESIPEDFALPSERRLAKWLRDGFGLTVMRVRNDESKKSPDAVVPTGAWIGTVDFKELTTLNSLRSEIAEGSLQSSRMVIDMVGDEVTQAQLAEHIRLGIWGAPSQVTEVIVRHRGLVLHWKLP